MHSALAPTPSPVRLLFSVRVRSNGNLLKYLVAGPSSLSRRLRALRARVEVLRGEKGRSEEESTASTNAVLQQQRALVFFLGQFFFLVGFIDLREGCLCLFCVLLLLSCLPSPAELLLRSSKLYCSRLKRFLRRASHCFSPTTARDDKQERQPLLAPPPSPSSAHASMSSAGAQYRFLKPKDTWFDLEFEQLGLEVAGYAKNKVRESKREGRSEKETEGVRDGRVSEQEWSVHVRLSPVF